MANRIRLTKTGKLKLKLNKSMHFAYRYYDSCRKEFGGSKEVNVNKVKRIYKS